MDYKMAPVEEAEKKPETPESETVVLTGTDTKQSRLTFRVDENPPLHIAVFYAFQREWNEPAIIKHLLDEIRPHKHSAHSIFLMWTNQVQYIFRLLQMVVSNLPGNVSAVFLIHATICGGRDYVFLAQMLSTSIVMTGVASLLQVTLGVRLPIAQGSAFSFFPPIIALMTTESWQCPDEAILQFTNGSLFMTGGNGSLADGVALEEEPWRIRIRLVSGGLVLASLVQIVMGVTGLVGFFTSFIGPVTIAPCIMLIGICLFGFVKDASKQQWGVALLTAALMIIFSVILGDIKLPVINWSREKGVHVVWYPLIRMFSNILAVAIGWLLCLILTSAGSFPDDPGAIGYLARTDAKLDAIDKMDWFYFPYPGQFGAPIFGGVNIFIGMLAATLSSIVESVGDYYATARICELPAPPKHAMNRGIALEGTASLIGGFVGSCHGTTSLSQMVGFIAYTGVASRITWIIMSVMLIIIGILGKFTGALATVPDPVIGGACLLSLGLVISVGISQLHAVDLEATRNQMALGMALMLGVMMPHYIEDDPSVINTGSEQLDQVIIVFLRTGPFVGGVVGCILDNLLPGSKKERGMEVLPQEPANSQNYKMDDYSVYDLPFSTERLRRFTLFTWLPCLPCYIDRKTSCVCCKRQSPKHHTVPQQPLNVDH